MRAGCAEPAAPPLGARFVYTGWFDQHIVYFVSREQSKRSSSYFVRARDIISNTSRTRPDDDVFYLFLPFICSCTNAAEWSIIIRTAGLRARDN